VLIGFTGFEQSDAYARAYLDQPFWLFLIAEADVFNMGDEL
jgi:hypothetical protein